MRKFLLLSAVALIASSSTGCECARHCCGGGGGLFGFGLLGNRQPAYAAAPMCCPQAVECCDPCADGTMISNEVIGAPTTMVAPQVMQAPTMMTSPMVNNGATCCN